MEPEQMTAVLTCLEHDVFLAFGSRILKTNRKRARVPYTIRRMGQTAGTFGTGLPQPLRRAVAYSPKMRMRKPIRTRQGGKRALRLKHRRRTSSAFYERRIMSASDTGQFSGAWRRQWRKNNRYIRTRPELRCRRCYTAYSLDGVDPQYMARCFGDRHW